MLFFLQTFFSLILFGNFALGEHHNQVHQYSRIPEQTITYEQLTGPPQTRVIELAPSKNVVDLHFFNNGGMFGSSKNSVASTQSSSFSVPVSTSSSPSYVQDSIINDSHFSETPSNSFMKRTNYVKPQIYSPTVHHQQYNNVAPIYRTVDSPYYSSLSSRNSAYPAYARTFYVPAQPITQNPNMIRIVPATYHQPMFQTDLTGRSRSIETMIDRSKIVPEKQPYAVNELHVIRIVDPKQWTDNKPVIPKNVIRVPTLVSSDEPKYTLITINSPIHTEIPSFSKVFQSPSSGMTGSQNFDRIAVPISGRSSEPEPLMIRAASFSSKPSTEVRAPIFKEKNVSQTTGGIIVHRLEEEKKTSREEPKAKDVAKEVQKKSETSELKPEEVDQPTVDQPTVELTLPEENVKKSTIEPSKIIAKPIKVNIGSLSSRNVLNNVENFESHKIEQTKEDPKNEETLES